MNEQTGLEALSGTVEDIKFRNEENGYTVLEIGCEEELVTAVGLFSEIYIGESVELAGAWTMHPTFGRQFKAEKFVRRAPHTIEQLYHYLSAGAVKGIPVVHTKPIPGCETCNLEFFTTKGMSVSYPLQFHLKPLILFAHSFY